MRDLTYVYAAGYYHNKHAGSNLLFSNRILTDSLEHTMQVCGKGLLQRFLPL